MANVFDVAAYILERQGPMTTWKLQKPVSYAQAWSPVWDDDALHVVQRGNRARLPSIRD